jgi:hypothetical protein
MDSGLAAFAAPRNDEFNLNLRFYRRDISVLRMAAFERLSLLS